MTDSFETLKAALSDRYAIERELGAGGMATVYLAEDLRHHRKVAVKVLRPDLAMTLGAERFLREVTVAANLQHPHVLPLYDSGAAEGFLFYVMPYVQGPSLRQKLIREGELPVHDAVRILRDVADALAYSHHQGVVHRDIKPENVMLSGRHALVTDFGVAKAVSEATGRQQITTAGVALGTPAYMAPEQAAADPHMDHRADIYAFGALAYEVLTGRPPFVGPTPQAVLASHMTAPAEPVTRHRASVPPELQALVMRCLEKKPADRWQSANELLLHLESLLTPSGGMTPTATAPVSMVPPADRARRRWILGIVGALAVAVLAVVGLRSHGGAADEGGTVAVFPFAIHSADSADVWLAEGLSDQIGSQLARRPEVRVLSSNAVAAEQQKTSDPLEAGRALNARWVVTGTLRHADNDIQARVEVALASTGIQAWSSSFGRADGDFAALQREVADSVARVLVGRVAPSVATAVASDSATDPEAYRLYLIANALLNRRTPETAARAVANYQAAIRRAPRFAAGWAELGEARLVQYTWNWPAPDAPHDSLPTLTRNALATALALDSGNAVAIRTMGSVDAWIDGDFVAARHEFERALRLDSTDARIWYAYGSAFGGELGQDLPTAERLFRTSLAMDPDQPNAWRHLAVTVERQGRFAEAEAILDTLVALGPWAPALNDRAYVRFLRGNGRGALDDLGKASRLTGNPTDTFSVALYTVATGDEGPAHAWVARGDTSSADLAEMNMALGRRQQALQALSRRDPDISTWGLLHDPIFMPLRDDAAFVELLKKSRPKGIG